MFHSFAQPEGFGLVEKGLGLKLGIAGGSGVPLEMLFMPILYQSGTYFPAKNWDISQQSPSLSSVSGSRCGSPFLRRGHQLFTELLPWTATLELLPCFGCPVPSTPRGSNPLRGESTHSSTTLASCSLPWEGHQELQS